MNFDFTAASGLCVDPWLGQAFGSWDYTAGFGGPNRARIHTVCSIPESNPITGTDEYYFAKVTFLGSKSLGTNGCPGYTDGACIVLNSIKLTQALGAPGGDVTIYNPLFRSYVLMQSGASSIGCPGATPARNSTWGTVKSLYRSLNLSSPPNPGSAFESRGSPG